MIEIEFKSPLTAYEIRDPAIEACESVAKDLGYFAKYHQPQQKALSGSPGERSRKRIGNGKHKDWYVDYQAEELSAARPTVFGRVVLASATIKEIMQFGGFDYGEYRQPLPTYDRMTVDVPTIPHHYRPIIPTDEMVDMTYQRIQARFDT